MNTRSPFERLAEAHVRAWTDLASSTAAIANLPARTWQALTGAEPGLDETPLSVWQKRAEAAEAEALRWQSQGERLQTVLEQAERDHRALVAELRRSYAVLERGVADQVAQALSDQKRSLYAVLEPMLTQLPVVRRSIAQGRQVDALDVIDLLSPLDEALKTLGFQPIGTVGTEVAFDPTVHQVAQGAAPQPGTTVTVKNVGYLLDGAILRKARVTTPARVRPNAASDN
jgi:molecular chaperone GrpE (heat shock protein)